MEYLQGCAMDITVDMCVLLSGQMDMSTEEWSLADTRGHCRTLLDMHEHASTFVDIRGHPWPFVDMKDLWTFLDIFVVIFVIQ
jgi:hypothetical protein